MGSIETTGRIGDKILKVHIYAANGAGGDRYFIIIDKRYHGTLTKIPNGWVAHLNQKSQLTSDDIQIFIEMLDKMEGEGSAP